MKYQPVLDSLAAYQKLNLSAVIDFDKFNLFAITHQSTAIEGSTLTETETQLLLDENLTPKGKPLGHSLMVKDHAEALHFVLNCAAEKQPVSVAFIQQINSFVLKNTGAVYRTVFGDIDSSRGEFRKANVRAGNRYFSGFEKVEKLTVDLSGRLNSQLNAANTTLEKLKLAFDAHFELVSIHPFYDGNGRTSRLLMNFIQHHFGLPISMVFSEDKAGYFEALEATRNYDDRAFFHDFMFSQYQKQLSGEVEKFNQATEK